MIFGVPPKKAKFGSKPIFEFFSWKLTVQTIFMPFFGHLGHFGHFLWITQKRGSIFFGTPLSPATINLAHLWKFGKQCNGWAESTSFLQLQSIYLWMFSTWQLWWYFCWFLNKHSLLRRQSPNREASPFQNGWIFGKVPNGLLPPPIFLLTIVKKP